MNFLIHEHRSRVINRNNRVDLLVALGNRFSESNRFGANSNASDVRFKMNTGVNTARGHPDGRTNRMPVLPIAPPDSVFRRLDQFLVNKISHY